MIASSRRGNSSPKQQQQYRGRCGDRGVAQIALAEADEHLVEEHSFIYDDLPSYLILHKLFKLISA